MLKFEKLFMINRYILAANIFDRIIKANAWHLLMATIILAEIFTFMMNAIQSYLWWGYFSTDLILIGTIDAFVVTLLAAPPIIYAARADGKRLRDITSALGEGVYVLNDKGRLILMNHAAERLLGWTEKELAGKNIHKTIHGCKENGSKLSEDDCPIMQVFKNGSVYISDDEVFTRKDGSTFAVSCIATPIIEDGRVIASVTAFQDITGRKELEKDLKRHIYEIESFNRLSVGRELRIIELKKRGESPFERTRQKRKI